MGLEGQIGKGRAWRQEYKARGGSGHEEKTELISIFKVKANLDRYGGWQEGE